MVDLLTFPNHCKHKVSLFLLTANPICENAVNSNAAMGHSKLLALEFTKTCAPRPEKTRAQTESNPSGIRLIDLDWPNWAGSPRIPLPKCPEIKSLTYEMHLFPENLLCFWTYNTLLKNQYANGQATIRPCANTGLNACKEKQKSEKTHSSFRFLFCPALLGVTASGLSVSPFSDKSLTTSRRDDSTLFLVTSATLVVTSALLVVTRSY